RRAWIAEREIAETGLVRVGDAVQIYAFGAAVFNAPNDLAGELMLHRRVPHVSVGRLYVWINNSRSDYGQWKRATAACQRPIVIRRDRTRNSQHGVIGRVLDHVEGDVAEIAFVTNAVSGT